MEQHLDEDYLLPQKNIEITINSIENIVWSEDEELYVTVEHNNVLVGETIITRIEPDSNEHTTFYDMDSVINYTFPPDDSGCIDTLVSTPILLRLFMAKENSVNSTSKIGNKNGKTVSPVSTLLGMCNVDLLPLLLGEHSFTQKLKLVLAEYVPDDTLSNDLPQLTVTIAQGDVPLLPPDETLNFLTITLESVYNPPQDFTNNLEYKARTIVYTNDEIPEYIIFFNGTWTKQQDMERVKVWNTLKKLQNHACLSNYKLSCDFLGIQNTLHEEFNLAEVSQDVPRIDWNCMSRQLLRKTGIESMKEHITRHRYWPFQFMVSKKNVNGSRTKLNVGQNKQQLYQCYIDASELIFPGKRSTRVVGQLYTFTPINTFEKSGLKQNIFSLDLEAKIPKEKNKTSKTDSLRSETESDTNIPLYDEAGKPTIVIVEIELYQPLIQSQTLRDFSYLIEELKSKKKKEPACSYSPNTAEIQYTNCIQKISSIITECYRDFLEKTRTIKIQNHVESRPGNDFAADEFASFTQYLFKTGVYSNIQSTLRTKVTTLLDQTFQIESTNIIESTETQNFIASIYMYLVEKMHFAVSEMIEGRFTDDLPELIPLNKLCFYAEEAYESESLEAAHYYYMLAIEMHKKNPESWTRYVIFLLKIHDLDRAVVCLREALLLDSRFRIGLIIYGAILLNKNEYKDAEIFFKAVTEIYPRFIEGWTILHLFYLKTDYASGADIALRIAQKCMKYKVRDMEMFNEEPMTWSMIHCPKDSVYALTATFLLKMNLCELSSIALAEEMKNSCDAVYALYYTSVKYYLTGEYETALLYLEQAQSIYGMDYSIGSLKGHCYFKRGDLKNAIDCYDYVYTLFDRPTSLHLIELRLGAHYIEIEDYERGRKIFLSACKYSPSSLTWLGVGVCLYKMKIFDQAEVALAEANRIDNRNPEIWAYLCLLNIALERYEETAQCYSESYKNNLKNRKLWMTLTESMEALGYAPPIAKFNVPENELIEEYR